MAVGGMVGGGIYTVLGVVLEISGTWFWLSFLITGCIAWLSAYAYSSLARMFGEGGGAFTFLREIDRDGMAGSLSWVLVLGYVLTISVYAFTFGHYVAFAFGGSALMARLAALAIVGVLVALNLRGTGQAALAEIVMVWSGIAILTALAIGGVWRGSWSNLFEGALASGPGATTDPSAHADGVVAGQTVPFFGTSSNKLLPKPWKL
jgi:amino acid transporter